MTLESASVTAIVIGAVAAVVGLIFALARAARTNARLERMAASPAVSAAIELPAQSARISTALQRLQQDGDRWQSIVESITSTRDAGSRLQSGVASVAACVIDLLDTFAPSQRGSAS